MCWFRREFDMPKPKRKCLSIEPLETRLALTSFWTGNGDGISWSDGQNWLDGITPPAGSDVVIDIEENSIIEFDIDNLALNSLLFDAPQTELFIEESTLSIESESSFQRGHIFLTNSFLQSASPLLNEAHIIVFGESLIEAPLTQAGQLIIEPNSFVTFADQLVNVGEIFVQENSNLAIEFVDLLNQDGLIHGPGQVSVMGGTVFGGSLPSLNVVDSDIMVESKFDHMTGALHSSGVVMGNANSNLQFEIDGVTPGSEFDHVLADQFQFDGQISVHFSDDFQPTPCSSFDIIETRDGVSGDFQVNVTGLPVDLQARTVVHENQLSIVTFDPNRPIQIDSNDAALQDGQTQYSICLGQMPNAVVEVFVTPNIEGANVTPSQILFDPELNWELPQTIEVDTVNLVVAPLGGSFPITHDVFSEDLNFDSELNPTLIPPKLISVPPPPNIAPDQLEPNNARDDAFEINSQDEALLNLSIDAPGNDDWFVWEADARGILAVDAFFEIDNGDLDLEIFDETGEVIYWSATTTDHEAVQLPVVPGDRIHIRVFGFYGATNPSYDLIVRLNPETPRLFVSAENEIRRYDLNGNQDSTFTHPLIEDFDVGDVEIGSGNLVYVLTDTTDGYSILEFTANGFFTRQFDLPPNVQPAPLDLQGFDVLEDSTFLIGTDAFTVARFDMELQEVESFPTGFATTDATVLSNGVATTSHFDQSGIAFINHSYDGGYWASLPNSNEVQQIGPAGNVLTTVSFDNQFEPIDALETDDNRLIVLGRTGPQTGAIRVIDFAIPENELLTEVNMNVFGLAVSEFEKMSRIPKPDTDGDGYLDEWETLGIDINDDGIIDLDLPRLGADPLHKDIFVEVDAMVDRGPSSLVPVFAKVNERGLTTSTQLDRVIDAFVNSPVPNPDGVNGIDLHILIDDTDLIQTPFASRWNDFDNIKDGNDDEFLTGQFGTDEDRSSLNWQAIRLAKKHVYRYGLFADSITGLRTSGVGELTGNDFLVTLGSFATPGGSGDQQAGTFMHELGHTLGLRHGGHDDVNYKPNYHSVMNYHWQFPNSQNSGWKIDFSDTRVTHLDELRLDETMGVGFEPPSNGIETRIIQVGPLPFAGAPFSGAFDWDRDGEISVGPHTVSDINRGIADTNEDGFVDFHDTSPGEFLQGSNDWRNLRYVFTNQQNFREFRDGDIDRNEDPDNDATNYLDSAPPDYYDDFSDDPDFGNDEIGDASFIDQLETIFGITIDTIADIDWFELDIDYVGEIVLGISFPATTGVPLILDVFDDSGNEVAMVEYVPGGDFRRISLPAVPDENYFIRVRGATGMEEGNYNLLINPGDTNSDGKIGPAEIDSICESIRANEYFRDMDFNTDQVLNLADIEFLLKEFLNTSRGDANLDGDFNSSDLIKVFIAGQYDDNVTENSTWATGDWNCDQEFDSSDLIVAFIDGRYEVTARIAPDLPSGAALNFELVETDEKENKHREILNKTYPMETTKHKAVL